MCIGQSLGIIHLDMDAFYAAAEVLDNPKLKGLPVIIGGLGTRGVVSTASYEARLFGVHSALPISTARRLCPHGVYIYPRLERYKELSSQIMAIFNRYTPLVEPLSLDEAFLDVTGSQRLFGPAEGIARRIKNEVLNEVGMTVTAGVASQKHLAKIASNMNKPDGLTVVPLGGEIAFLHPLPVKDLWGVGRVMQGHLKDLGIATVGDLARLERRFMEKKFGLSGGQLWDLSNGLDPRSVNPVHEAKSVGAEKTFGENLTTPEDIRAALLDQTLTAVGRMRKEGLLARTITVKFRDAAFKTITRAITLPSPTDLRDEIYKKVLGLYKKEGGKLGAMRLLGVSLSHLSQASDEGVSPAAPIQLSLFDLGDETPGPLTQAKPTKLNHALDRLADRFGEHAVRPATLVPPKAKPRTEPK